MSINDWNCYAVGPAIEGEAAMALLEWSESLDVHVDPMNIEHVELIRLMNVAYDVNGTGRVVVAAALSELVDFLVTHFAHEEAYMESVGFEGLETHRGIHDDLLAKMAKHVQDFRGSDSGVLPEEFFEFLKFWLVSHIQGIDAEYDKFVNSSPVRPSPAAV
ncbi:MAG: bacteriohemerythrin [Acidimicrobiales bacterium]